MSTSDPFSAFESDRTIIKPSAGRGARTAMQPPAAQQRVELAALPELPGGAGLGVLVQLASPLLMAGARLRGTLQHPDPRGLRATLADAISRFERDARARGLPQEHVVAGRYILCTFIDECASGTPWGGSGAWSAESLLVQFHNEAWGGEKVFQLLARLLDDPKAHQGLLELIYCVLSLGFEGRYRVARNGRFELEELRERLALTLREQAGGAPRELSPRWQGMPDAGRRLRDGVPFWVVATAVAVLLAGTFVSLRFAMSDRTDPVFGELQKLDLRAPTVQPPLLPLPAPAPATARAPGPALAAPAPVRLAVLLKPEVDAGLVEVRDHPDRSVVTLLGDAMFKPGSAELEPRALPLLRRVGEELARTEGQVLVTGHTDVQPIRSVRFPSNWHLSEERARFVRGKLAASVKPERLRSEGLADTQPVADNATPAGRARNRRVEITLRAG